ncbi:hypothetical protein IVB02_21330 [Bradyrhizobium sp. 166]|uniref:hypothetical protein n=1 Tax=Bradyrhizobium sp. 166 TaxID=2782638 RepID=UPI001FF959F2|nr:hypothetical protein [Bradyrhizobium sp. 166]MCK1603909.1 hypothetical protein [Bradyrhizobium sp. 166]
MSSNVKNPSIEWKKIRDRYEKEVCSIRALARDFHTTDTTIHRRAKAEGWRLFAPKRSVQRSLQHAVQQSVSNTDLWAFEPRRDALVNALQRVRNEVTDAEEAIHSDLPVVMALVWFQTPLADIAKAVQMSEPELERIFGKPILKHIRELHGPRARSA